MKKPSLLACLALLVFTRPAWTEPANLQPAASEDQADDRQRLEERLSPEARRRLRDELNDYSRKAYPDREQLEERRRLMHDRMQERLNSADKNGVGSISRSEAQLRMPRLARQFDQIDTNGDGVITREEMQAARDRMAQEKRETARVDNPGVDKPTKAQ